MAPFKTFSFALASFALLSAAPAAPAAPAAAPLPPELAGKEQCAAVQTAFAEMAQAERRIPGPPAGTGVARIKIIEGRGKRCWKWGICFIDVDDGPKCPRACLSARLTRGPGDTVVLEYTSARPMPEGETFGIERPMAVPASVARQIGARGALRLRPGEYRPVLSDGGRTIRVELPVEGRWMPEKDEVRG